MGIFLGPRDGPFVLRRLKNRRKYFEALFLASKELVKVWRLCLSSEQGILKKNECLDPTLLVYTT